MGDWARVYLLELLPFWSEISEFFAKLAWPVAAVIIARIFRNELSQLFQRITRVSLTGAEFGEVSDRQETRIHPRDLDELKKLPGMERTHAMADLEVLLHKNLEKIEAKDQVDLLVTELSRARLDVKNLTVYRLIFGSQIKFMKRIRQFGGFMDDTRAEHFFEDVKKIDRIHEDQSVKEFARYLENNNLIVHRENGFELTSNGDDFLLFLYRSALPEDLPL